MLKGIPATLVAFLLLGACHPKTVDHFDNAGFIRIADFQDRGNSDSLYRYLKSPDAGLRSAAALAFASVQDTLAAPALGSLLLEDKDSIVRQSAAFALGQTGGIAAVNALIPALTEKSSLVVREVAEALGKTVKKTDAAALRGFHPTDSLRQEGLAWGLFRLALRGLSTSEDMKTEAEFLNPRYSVMTRKGAAWFFGRGALPSQGYGNVLARAATSDAVVEVRMAAAAGLKKANADTAIAAIKQILKNEKDYRVRISAVRALTPFDASQTLPLLINSLTDSNVNVGIAASEVMGVVVKTPSPELENITVSTANWRIQANLYKTVYRNAPSAELNEQMQLLFTRSKNNYQKAWLLEALAGDSENFAFVLQVLLTSKVFVVKSSAAEALVAMNREKRFDSSLKPKFALGYQQAIEDGDPAVIGAICGALADSTLGYRSEIKDLKFLYDAKARLKLPLDIESLTPLNDAIAWLEHKPKPAIPKNEFNHPISWEQVRSIRKHPRVLVVTSKGEIEMRLLEDEAPGSAANFAALAEQHYFDGKKFHRTVPNFVIQTGCKRGDGSGSEDYSIRSEFTERRYSEGSVGMASAGKNTEGTQWFITHSSTPHLDGRYTIFAQVEKGMEVVHRIEVGDSIISVTLIPN